ncbi:MAG: polyribonucleotide nucleotidyltransferase [Sedimentisphaerales bacterium]|nr:polyribonucleotide nucleotidyltransferase [Sedimentisphaerales bacterium]
MPDLVRVEREIGGRKLSVETGKIARQADGAVVVQYGETAVLVTAVSAPPRAEDIDFFPLSVEYREKQSAAGKFPGGFIKREGRPSTKETLTARMIDRPLRPLFPDGYFDEVQVIATVLSADKDNDPDVPAMIGASAALTISKIPFMGPTGACRIGLVDGQIVVNPTHEQMNKGALNILIGGRKDSINMIEVAAKELPESVVAEAVKAGHEAVKVVCELIEELRQKTGVEKEKPEIVEIDAELYSKIRGQIFEELSRAKLIPAKQQRGEAVKEIQERLIEQHCQTESESAEQPAEAMVKRIFDKIEGEIVRKQVLEGKRLDGRGYDDVRPISCEAAILPRVHGSALFTRGETQSLAIVTLGTIRDAQIIDGLLDEYTQNFTLHYNFPPFSVGEVKPVRGPGRREIGHGALAERALEQVRPPEEEFAYTVRIVSDITESNGSSSMASVCAGSLALMDAGVPIKKAVAGVSIGMVTAEDGGRYVLLTDIIGDEDHHGDMDFKVAGTTEGITAIQLDIKAEGLPHNIMVEAMEKARQARLKILDIMSKAIDKPRAELSVYAPKLITIEIDPEFIGKIIGPGGKNIKALQEETDTTIEIEEDGTVFISCIGGDGHLKAKEIIEAMTTPPEPGRLYPNAKVVSVKEFGAFVEFLPGVEGLCHISELSDGYVKNVENVCKVGDVIPVKLLSIDDQGRFKLSRKAALLEMGGSDKKKEPPKKK